MLPRVSSDAYFLSGGGEAGRVAREVDWSNTPLGPPESWPASLKTTVGILLHSRHPMFLWWGNDLIQLYNDAYLPSFGVGKHPAAMGQRGVDCWQEIWPIIWPQIDDVMQRGRASWNEDHLVPIYRNGCIEEVYWTYGYSPVFDDRGAIGGTLVVCTETTGRVLAERRLRLIRSLAVALATAEDAAQVTDLTAQVLPHETRDLAFTLIFDGGAPRVIGLDDATPIVRAVSGVLEREGRVQLDTPVTAGSWPEPVTELYVAPLDGTGLALVFGLSPRLPFDEAYRGFLQQIVEQVVAARSRARIESERRRLLEQAPVATALLIGPEHVFAVANPLYRQIVGGRDLLGKSYLEAFPELRDTELPAVLDRVYQSGEPFVTEDMLIPLDRRGTGVLEDCFFKYTLEPIRNAEGHVYGMMAVAVDITAQVRASRAKDEFLAMLGHELRNPLAPILTAVELMKLRAGDAVAREREIIERQSRHLVHLVDDLLDVSRVAQGKIELRKARISLGEVVSRAVETATPLFEQKAQRLDVVVPNDLDVDADLVRLSQVVANLLTNAARYTDAGGEISIVAAREGEEIVLRVRDNGSGIAPEQLPHLFDAFFQGKRAPDRSQGGLGLGLALVKSLMTLHGGAVSAHSAGLGKGSCFELRLPPAQLAAEAPEASSAAPEAVAATRVLMVDDNPDISEVFAAFLSTFGFEVRTAHDGPSALEIADTFHPSVAVLDLGLPVMDGYELAARLRERLGADTPRLIAMTGYGQQSDREQTQEAGFERHFVKPVDAYALVAAISEPPPPLV